MFAPLRDYSAHRHRHTPPPHLDGYFRHSIAFTNLGVFVRGMKSVVDAGLSQEKSGLLFPAY